MQTKNTNPRPPKTKPKQANKTTINNNLTNSDRASCAEQKTKERTADSYITETVAQGKQQKVLKFCFQINRVQTSGHMTEGTEQISFLVLRCLFFPRESITNIFLRISAAILRCATRSTVLTFLAFPRSSIQ